jgi:hypothetical protein
MHEQLCPICNGSLRENPRYPNLICSDCASRTTSQDGRPLEFFNVDMSGGYKAQYADDQSEYDSHRCYIDGVECHADEAKFGGIVIELVHPAD